MQIVTHLKLASYPVRILAEPRERFPYAGGEWLISIDRGLLVKNLLEPCFYFRIKRKVAVSSRMFTSMGVGLQAPADGFVGADAFENVPPLMQGGRCHGDVFDLVAA
jgi:hypothetical protein